MAVSRHLGFYRTAHSAIRSADPEDPRRPGTKHGVDRMHRSKIFASKLYRDLETGVRGHSKSSKVALFDSTYDFIFIFHSNYAFIYYRFRDIASYWSKIATPLVFGAPVGGEVVRFTQRPLVTKS